MILKVKILDKSSKPFTGGDGEERDYFWYKMERQDNQVTIRVGSVDGKHEVDEVKDLNIEKYERNDGKMGYREII